MFTHGGVRPGAGRKPAPTPKPKKHYVRLPIEQPVTELERLALTWWGTLTPQDRLAQITEDHTYQPGHAGRVGWSE